MAWTETWTGTFEIYDPSPWLSELQIALNERVDIANGRQDKLSTIAKPSFLSATATDFAAFSTQTIAGQIRDLIDDLIPEYANTTDADEWEGVDYSVAPPFPYWTEASLLSALSESRIDHSELDEFNFEWISQQKRILDKLRWTSQLLKDVSAPSAIACNACAPPIPARFSVALSGLVAPFDHWNGSHIVEWSSGCIWIAPEKPAGATGTSSLKLSWDAEFSNKWDVRLNAFTGAYLLWEGTASACAPLGSFAHDSCNDPGGAGWCTAQDAAAATTCTVTLGDAIGFVNSQFRQGTGATFAAAVTAWNASAYAVGDGGETDDSTVRESGGTYTVHRRRFDFGPESDEDEYSLDAPTVTKLFVGGSPTATPKKTFNVYTALTVSPSGAYENNDYDGGNDEFSIIPVAGAGGGSTPTLTATVPTITVGDFPTFTSTDPGSGNENGWKVRQPFVIYVLHKWDVTDGLDKVI